MPTRKETLWFIALALLLSWGVGAWWLLDERRFILIRLLMCIPAFVAMGCAWAFRREAPRAAGFAFTGWRPWLLAMAYPWIMILVCLGLAYLWRALSGRADFIYLRPLAEFKFGISKNLGFQGLPALGFAAAAWVVLLLPWLLVATAYRAQWPDRLKAALPSPWSWLHHAFRAALFVPTFLIHGVFPGELGEEMGWRGHLVRRWADRPLVAVAITMPVWASFHLPVIFSSAQKGHPVLNAVFLLSIAAAAVPFAALYLWGRSVWPCAVLHLSWNLWNPIVLGNVYTGHAGLFGGQVRIFNGEALFGLIFNAILALWLITMWRREASRTRASLPEG
ncbi:MAG: CPBP family intramembrane metalloprotease [Geothrix sp.]|uniref:CPBP family glutamic-type intramembrane protease n=1 Tax=Geothrix sp. TaxID=1962974 RepID=UPI0017B74609|nr:CPBP family glutamic-type intramembrane protease [Geothrix sp.]NWJ39613.1 CPBP family intramembrane metalloprotease [Geothrix sp.]WIL22364.1 MAG: CPBP family glutamic-type intramembrane protease [Geothrix sp.]